MPSHDWLPGVNCSRRLGRSVLALAVLLGMSLGAAGTAVTRADAAPTSRSNIAHASLTKPNAAKPKHAKQKSHPAAFGIGAANSKGFDGRAYLNFLVSPGGKSQDHVAVVNLTTRTLRIAVYPVDSNTSPDGSLGFAPRSAKPLDAGSWIHVVTPNNRSSVRVPARSKVVLPVKVIVPANAQPGDHAAAIIASVTSKVVAKGGTSQNLGLEQRVALRTFFRISGPLGPKLEVQGLTVSDPVSWNPISGSTATVTYRVRNTGNVRLGARQAVTISGLFHTATATVKSVPVLLPGGTADYRVRVTGVYPQLHMTARVSLRPIPVPGDADPPLPGSYDSTDGFWAIPWPLLIAVVALLVLIVGLVLRASRRRKSTMHSPPSNEEVREEQPA
jgi:hypothetical protein